MIIHEVGKMINKDLYIDSVKSISKAINDPEGKIIKSYEIRKILKNEMGMRFKKVNAVSIHANSEKNLVL